MPDIDDVTRSALPIEEEADLDPVLDRIGDARCVLLGEASHGTHEYHAWRAALTRRLIAERAFSFVAVDGDWPDCRRVHRSVTGAPGADGDPRAALDALRRWPAWTWANHETVAFCRWLRGHNAALPPERRAGFYGLDVYSLRDSLRAVMVHLAEHRPEHLAAAREAYRCFEPYGDDPRGYARLVPEDCAEEVLALLTRLRRAAGGRAAPAADPAADRAERLDARLNAEAAAGAERYYRAMIGGGERSWNARDTHMADTLERLLEFHGPRSRAVVWAHNTHVGDARGTDMGRAGLVNLGRLVRGRHGAADTVLVGFAGGYGEVVAGPRWGAPMELMRVPPPRSDSVEALLSCAGLHRALFVFPAAPGARWLTATRVQRAIGAVYDPDHELDNYVPTRLGERYDVLCWFARTSALDPLHLEASPRGGPETLATGV